MKKTIELAYKKSTKGTHVYENPDYGLSFYLPKLLLDNPSSQPKILKITLEAEEK